MWSGACGWAGSRLLADAHSSRLLLVTRPRQTTRRRTAAELGLCQEPSRPSAAALDHRPTSSIGRQLGDGYQADDLIAGLRLCKLSRVGPDVSAKSGVGMLMNRPGLVGDSWPWKHKDGV